MDSVMSKTFALWKECKMLVCNQKISQLGFQRCKAKKELLLHYPYIKSFELYYFLKDGYESPNIHYCKYCKEPITKYNKTDFCCAKHKHLYYDLIKENETKLIEESKNIVCNANNIECVRGINPSINPLILLSKLYNIDLIYLYNFFKYGIDDETICPICGEYTHYNKTYCSVTCSNKRNIGKKFEYKSWEDTMGIERAKERKKKLIERQTGKHHSNEWREHQKQWYKIKNNKDNFKIILSKFNKTDSYRKKMSNSIKQAIKDGKFTPQCNGGRRKSHWFNFDRKKFRSRFEIIFYAYYKYYLNKNIEFEYVRIPYKDKNNVEHIYIVDFFDPDSGIIYEIKPSSCITLELKEKLKASINYAKLHGYKYKIITEEKLKAMLKLLFTEFNNISELQSIFKAYKSWIKN